MSLTRNSTRLVRGTLALLLVALLAPAVQAAPASGLVLSVPAGSPVGETTALKLRLPGNVGAVDGRLFFNASALELVGVAPSGGGTAFAPVQIAGGAAFGAYNLKASGANTVLNLVVVPRTSARIAVRVVLDGIADRTGRRVTLPASEGNATLRAGSGAASVAAPAGNGRIQPLRPAGALRTLVGAPTLGARDLDQIGAAWEEARLNNLTCAAASAAADANNDGCVDVVDAQALTAAQGARVAANPAVTSVSTRASGVSGPAAARPTAIGAAAFTATFTVTHTGDGADSNPGNGVCADNQGRCTLRAAIQEANWSRGQDLINFALTGTAPVRISINSVLPHINDRTGGVTIDGYSQPGAQVNTAQNGSNARPGVEIVGTGGSPRTNIFRITSSGNVIRGFALNTAWRTIVLSGADADNNQVLGNWIGFTNTGAADSYGGNVGVWLDNGASGNRIGSPALADRNIIGSSTWGIDHYGPGTDSNAIQNNDFCMTPAGGRASCQTAIDYNFGPKDNLVGGFGNNEKNVTGPTSLNGVEISHGWDPDGNDTSNKWVNMRNHVDGNWIGFRNNGNYDADYRAGQNNPGASGDNGNGVNVYDGCRDNVVDGNWIASGYDGVNTMRSNCFNTEIRNNIIGLSPNGQPAPLNRWGINVRQGTTEHYVHDNVIRNAASGGIGLSTGNERRIRISRNLVFDTNGPAILLTAAGGSSAPGSNNMFASPVITSATTSLVQGTGTAGATVEVFRASRPAGQSGLPAEFLGSATVAGNGTWSVPVTVATNQRVTASQIATNGHTSMLGTNVTANFAPPPPAPVADFSWSQLAGGRTVNFTDTSTNNPTSWLWNFGDGSTSTQQNPSHTYATANTYAVSLTATNGGGSDGRTRNVQVTDPPAGVTYAADAFGRNVNDAWGTADVGGAYTVQNTAGNYDVAAGFGTMVLPSGGALRSALLNGVSARDVDITFQVTADESPTGGAYWVYGVARRNGNNEYRPKIRILADGRVGVHAGRVINNTESAIAPEVIVAGLTLTPGNQINVRAQVTGTGTTTIRVKAWAEGQAEPSGWQFTATDTNANLQSAGSVGLRVFIGSNVSNAPVTFSFDDYAVTAP